jgi:hypothetical protein
LRETAKEVVGTVRVGLLFIVFKVLFEALFVEPTPTAQPEEAVIGHHLLATGAQSDLVLALLHLLLQELFLRLICDYFAPGVVFVFLRAVAFIVLLLNHYWHVFRSRGLLLLGICWNSLVQN